VSGEVIITGNTEPAEKKKETLNLEDSLVEKIGTP